MKNNLQKAINLLIKNGVPVNEKRIRTLTEIMNEYSQVKLLLYATGTLNDKRIRQRYKRCCSLGVIRNPMRKLWCIYENKKGELNDY